MHSDSRVHDQRKLKICALTLTSAANGGERTNEARLAGEVRPNFEVQNAVRRSVGQVGAGDANAGDFGDVIRREAEFAARVAKERAHAGVDKTFVTLSCFVE